MNMKFTEKYSEVGAAFQISINRIIYNEKSAFQKIQIAESQYFGRILIIDDCIMLTERDEFVYHEMIAHIPLFVHPAPQRVLVIGGGDGGTVREILKHPEVEQVILVEIDRKVTEACLQYLPKVSSRLLSARVSCLFQDAVAFIKSVDADFDIIIIDSTDPVNVGEGLFTKTFYQDCFKALAADGILVNQAESPFFTPKWVKSIAEKLKSVFSGTYFYSAQVPTYPSGYWLFGFASKRYHPVEDFRNERYRKNDIETYYYHEDLHRTAFTLPLFVRKMIDES